MKNEKLKIRVRMAPSPTGPLHIGTARTALFNYLFAKKFQGDFILRIEDTDKERSRPEWEKEIIDGLHWLGIDWNEGPYRQSERTEIYKKYLEKLMTDKQAYWCFCPPEKEKAKEILSQIHKCDCAEKQKNEKETAVIRFKMPKTTVAFKDLVRGKISYDGSLFGDIIIAKNLEEPLYNFACVIDDWEMKISHVIRGEDHISNTPKQILLAQALGFDSPEFLHLPLILGTDKTKLSKRHGTTTSIDAYKKQGYLSQALINFIALLGWNPGDNREVLSMSDLEKDFSVEKIQKSGAIFNAQKLDWLNGGFIRKMPLDELTKLCLPYLIETGLVKRGEASVEKIAPMVALYQERLKKLSEISELIDFFFKDKLEYEKDLLIWKGAGDSEIISALDKLANTLSNIDENVWTEEKINEIIMPIANELGDRGKMLWPMRAALSGKQASAGPFEIAEVLGKEKTLQRIRQAIEKFE